MRNNENYIVGKFCENKIFLLFVKIQRRDVSLRQNRFGTVSRLCASCEVQTGLTQLPPNY